MSSWETAQQILDKLNKILAKEDYFDKLQQEVQNLEDSVRILRQGQATLADSLSSLIQAAQSCCNEQNGLLQQILANTQEILNDLVPPQAVTFIATITLNSQGENTMAKKAAGVSGDLQVADNGTFTVSLTFQDADGVATTVPAGLSATYTASDATPGPSALTLTPSADTSSCAGSINQTTIQALVAAGTALPTGLTVSVSATWTGLASPVSVVATPPIDVVPGPASTFVAADTTP
jgi:hypothetical protein